jgi:hypothetical protein
MNLAAKMDADLLSIEREVENSGHGRTLPAPPKSIFQPPYRLSHFHYTNHLFTLVLELRGRHQTGGELEDVFDRTADHYLLFRDGVPILAMRVNQARRGPMDCEEFYPGNLLSVFRNMVGSASRLIKAKEARGNASETFSLIAAVWRDQFLDGMRIDLINVHMPMIPFYRRLGYRTVPHSRFKHPRLGTDSLVMFLTANACGDSRIADAFGTAHDPVLMATLESQIGNCECPVADYKPSEGCFCPKRARDATLTRRSD